MFKMPLCPLGSAVFSRVLPEQHFPEGRCRALANASIGPPCTIALKATSSIGQAAGLADFSDQSCRWHRGNRPLRAADDSVPAALLPCDSASRTSTVGIVRGDDKSDRGVDFAPDYRGVSLGQFTSLSYSGSRHCVWPGLQAAVACHGHSGQADCSPIAVAESVRRETDRHDPTGMSRPHDRIWGGAPAPDPWSVCRVL